MQIFGLTCLSLTSITYERIELQSSDWTQKTRFFQAAFSAFDFILTCLSLTSITFERKELQSSDWTQKTPFFKLYPNMLSVHFDIIFICSFSEEKLKFVFFIDLSCTQGHHSFLMYSMMFFVCNKR